MDMGAHVMVNSSPKTGWLPPLKGHVSWQPGPWGWSLSLCVLTTKLWLNARLWGVVTPMHFAQSLCSPEVGSEWVSFFPLGTELTLRETPSPVMQGSPEPGYSSSCMHPMWSNQSFPRWAREWPAIRCNSSSMGNTHTGESNAKMNWKTTKIAAKLTTNISIKQFRNYFRPLGSFPFGVLRVFSSSIPSNKCISYGILEKGVWTFLRIKEECRCKMFLFQSPW